VEAARYEAALADSDRCAPRAPGACAQAVR